MTAAVTVVVWVVASGLFLGIIGCFIWAMTR